MCKLISLEFWNIEWWGSEVHDNAAVEFVIELAHYLKDNPNIVSTNRKDFMSDDLTLGEGNNIVYTTHIAPILEHNCLTQILKTLRERGNYQEPGFLVAEAVGTWFAGKVSSCYTIIKSNVDVLISYLSS